MALTLAEIKHPNSSSTDFSFPPFRGKLMDVTFDNAYLTTGEVITAAQLGWVYAFGGLVMIAPSNAAGTLSLDLLVKPVANGTSLKLVAQETGAAVDGPFKEVTTGQDISVYTARILFLGY